MAQNTLGTAEAQVDVSVEAGHRRPGAPEVSVDPTQIVVAGQTARLRCSATGRVHFCVWVQDPQREALWLRLATGADQGLGGDPGWV